MAAKKKSAVPATKPKGPGKSLAELRSVLDKRFIIPQKIAAALKQLGDTAEYEQEFQVMVGCAVKELAKVREQFADHIVVTVGKNPKRLYCGTKELADEVRKMVAL